MDEKDEPRMTTWHGKPTAELSREELLEMVTWCSAEIDRLRADVRRRSQWGVRWVSLMQAV